MAITVTLYSFTKRENSTKRPTSGGTDYSCVLIDETSLMNPVFKLEIGSNPIGKNYCYVSDFNRYYFITDITSSQNFWYISCKCDVLASFKTEIGSQSHYVLRSASDYDGYIVDSVYPAKADEHVAKYIATNPLYWGSSNAHSYVLAIIGYSPTSGKQIGSVTYYHMDETALNNFCYFLMHNVADWSDIATAEYDPAVQAALLNPIQYIVSCKAFPVAPPDSLSISKIYFGYYEYGINSGKAKVIGVNEYVNESTVFSSIPHHPEAATRGKYLNGAPYSEYILRCGPWGDIPLDPAIMLDRTGEGLTCSIRYDLIQGVGRLAVYPTSYPNMILFNGATNIAADINLSQVLKNPLDGAVARNNAGLGFAGGALELLSGKVQGFTNAVSSLFKGVEDATRLKYPSVSGSGTTGSFLSFIDSDYAFYLMHKYYNIVEENNTELGRPLCKLKQINTLSGYILCQGADAQITGTSDEATLINSYMNSGFFYE